MDYAINHVVTNASGNVWDQNVGRVDVSQWITPGIAGASSGILDATTTAYPSSNVGYYNYVWTPLTFDWSTFTEDHSGNTVGSVWSGQDNSKDCAADQKQPEEKECVSLDPAELYGEEEGGNDNV